MAKLFRYIALISSIVFMLSMVGCQKGFNLSDDMKTMQEVSFSSKVMTGGEKSGLNVSDGTGVNYALIEIDSVEYRPEVFTLEGVIYTQAIKLPPGSYILNRFLMMNDNQTPDDYTDDIIMLAAPQEGSVFSAFVSQAAGFSFAVDNLKKANIPVEVIYFNPSDYTKFGFDFGVLPSTTIRQQSFIGNFNTCHVADYSGSLYAQQSGGLQNNMKAIFKIDVYRNGRFVETYGNESNKGDSAVVVKYPDGDNTNDIFRFELWVYGKSGPAFQYKHIHTWTFSNDEQIAVEADGLVHFSMGGNSGGTNTFLFGPDVNLPTEVTFTINSPWAPGTLGAYFDASLSNVPMGASIGNGLYRSWCGTDSVSINTLYAYQMDVYSSLYPAAMPVYTNNVQRWNEVNWLFNHLDDFNGYTFEEIQGAVWLILNDWDGEGKENIPNQNSLMTQMAQEAKSHPAFIPVCGEKAAVVFVPKGTRPQAAIPLVQVVFIISYL